MVDTSKAPYFSRFKPSKEYTKLLYNPDRPLQASELVESQEILHHYLSTLSYSFFEDGNLVSDMDYLIEDDTITVFSGRVYLDGKVRDFNQQTIPFDSEGTFEVGVKLEQKIITHNDDEELLDQVSGVSSYLSPGADRLKETVVLVANDEEAAPIYEFRDGELFIQSQNPEISKINDILAERTYDESGSYRVYGFDIYSEEHPTDENKIMLVIDSGRAYVLGYKVDKPSSTRIPIDKALETRTANAEAFFYDNQTRRGRLGNAPVHEVNRVIGQVQVNRQLVSRRSTPNGTDTLPHNSVFQINKVWTESGGETSQEFVRGRDFQLVNGNAIDWSPSGNEPSAGSSYYVSYQYNKTMVKDTDYKITIEGTGDNRRWFIDFNGMNGNKPVVGSMVSVDYTYYLARVDLIVLDKDGEIHVNKGQPDSVEQADAPYYNDPYTLHLGNIMIYPGSNTTRAAKSNLNRLSMEELQKVKTRVDNMEFNQAINALDQPAMAGINPPTLRGVFSDGFISTDKADTSHPDMNVAFSFEDAEITLPYADVTAHKPSMLRGSSIAHTWGRLVTAPFNEHVGISQSQATETFNVNPYNVFNNRAQLKLTPSEDSWVEESNVTVLREDYTPEVNQIRLRRWWAHPDRSKTQLDKAIGSMISLDEGQDWDMRDQGMYLKKDTQYGRTGTVLRDGGKQTIDTAIEFMRQIRVQFEGTSFLPNSNNLQLLFDGVRVPITPASGYSRGTESGTIRANADGTVKGSFTIPPGIRTGNRQVFLQNADNAGTTVFVSQGRNRRVEDVIIRSHITVDLFDPLAQSFQFPTNQIVSSFGLYFASKDNTKNVSVQVRNITESGVPGKTVYASTTLTPSQVRVSDNATAETKVVFDDPLVMDAGQEYCVVILTNSDQYTMHVATRGQQDINSGSLISKNPYIQGVLYSSSNASAWTIHQDSDLKFNVYVAQFNKGAVLEFDTMQNLSADSILLLATYLTPENTSANWEIKIVMSNEPENVTVNNKAWVPIANAIDIEVGQIAREVKLKASFEANRNMSPLLSLNDITFTTFLTELRASYVGRQIDQSEAPYNTIRLRYEAYIPGNTDVVPRYSTDGNTWKNFESEPTVTEVDGMFKQFSYTEKVGDGNQTFDSSRIRLDLSSQQSFIRPRVRRLMVSHIDE